MADDPGRRRTVAVGGYTSTAVLAALTGAATAVWQVAVLRAGAWASRGLRVPARNALLADVVSPAAYGRAYGFERAMDNLGAIAGPLLALGLVAWVRVKWAIGLSVVPGLLAAVAIVYAIRQTRTATRRVRQPIRLQWRPVLVGQLGRLLAGIAVFELSNIAATLLILRATQLLTPAHGLTSATSLALWCYVGYNVAATLASVPAGRVSDRLGAHGPVVVLAAGLAAFAAGYFVFANGPTSVLLLVVPFVLVGVGIGAAETAEQAAVAALAPTSARGSAFGVLATVQAFGNLAASAIAGLLWTAISPAAAFVYLGALALVAVLAPVLVALPGRRAR